MLGYLAEGALISTLKPASSKAAAVLAPKHAITVSPCSQSGKFLRNAATPEGVNNGFNKTIQMY